MNLDGMGRNLVFILLFDSGRLRFNRRRVFLRIGRDKDLLFGDTPCCCSQRERDGKWKIICVDER
jgi:hypothetical protein